MKKNIILILSIFIFANYSLLSECNCEDWNMSDTDFYKEGEYKFNKGQIEDAIQCFTCAIKIKPTPDYYNKRGFCYLLKGNNNLAKEDFKEASKIAERLICSTPDKDHSKKALYFFNLGAMQEITGEYANARDNYEMAKDVFGDKDEANELKRFEIYHNLGVSYIFTEQYDEAFIALGEALAIIKEEGNTDIGDPPGSLFTELNQYYLIARDLKGKPTASISESEKIGPRNTWMLSVGISDYPVGINDLKYCKKDAEDFINIFKNQFGVKNSIKHNGVIIQTGMIQPLSEKDATVSNIQSKLDYFKNNVTKKDRVWVFLSGHGSSEGFVAYDGVYSYSDMVEDIQKIDAYEVVLIIDACLSGNIKILADRQEFQNMAVFISSSTSYQPSMDGIPGIRANGLFSDFFLKSMDKDNLKLFKVDTNIPIDGMVDLKEVFKSTTNKMDSELAEYRNIFSEKLKKAENEEEAEEIKKAISFFESFGLPRISNENKAEKIILYRYKK